jgi:hypothetical protein
MANSNPELPKDLHPGNIAAAVAHRMGAVGAVIVTDNGDGTIGFYAHGIDHSKANELLSVGIHINLTQHDAKVREGQAGAEAREMQEKIDADSRVAQ